MKRSTLILLVTLTWVACLWPLALLVYGAVTTSLVLAALPTWDLWQKLMKSRRAAAQTAGD